MKTNHLTGENALLKYFPQQKKHIFNVNSVKDNRVVMRYKCNLLKCYEGVGEKTSVINEKKAQILG